MMPNDIERFNAILRHADVFKSTHEEMEKLLSKYEGAMIESGEDNDGCLYYLICLLSMFLGRIEARAAETTSVQRSAREQLIEQMRLMGMLGTISKDGFEGPAIHEYSQRRKEFEEKTDTSVAASKLSKDRLTQYMIRYMLEHEDEAPFTPTALMHMIRRAYFQDKRYYVIASEAIARRRDCNPDLFTKVSDVRGGFRLSDFALDKLKSEKKTT